MQDPKHPYRNQNLGGVERKRLTADVRTLNTIIHEDDAPERPAGPDDFVRMKASQQETAQATAWAEAQKMLADKLGPLDNAA